MVVTRRLMAISVMAFGVLSVPRVVVGAPIGRLITGCEVVDIFADPGSDSGSETFLCVIPVPGGATESGIATAQAGFDYFSNIISPLLINGTAQQGGPFTRTFILQSFPTWGPGVRVVPTRLHLSGTVMDGDPNAPGSITFEEIGELGGPALRLSHTSTDSEEINITVLGDQAPSGVATLTLKITVDGAMAFRATQSAEFLGAAPEPSEWSMMLIGGVGAWITVRRRRTAS